MVQAVAELVEVGLQGLDLVQADCRAAAQSVSGSSPLTVADHTGPHSRSHPPGPAAAWHSHRRPCSSAAGGLGRPQSRPAASQCSPSPMSFALQVQACRTSGRSSSCRRATAKQNRALPKHGQVAKAVRSSTGAHLAHVGVLNVPLQLAACFQQDLQDRSSSSAGRSRARGVLLVLLWRQRRDPALA